MLAYHVNRVRDEVRVMINIGVGELSFLAGMIKGTFHDEALVELVVGVAVEIDAAGAVHLSIISFDMVN